MKKPVYLQPVWMCAFQNPVSLAIGIFGLLLALFSCSWNLAGVWLLALIWIEIASVHEFRAELHKEHSELLEAETFYHP